MVLKHAPLPLLLLLAAGCAGGGESTPPDTGSALTTYAGFERDFVTLQGDQVFVGSLMRGDKDFVSGSFSLIGQADEGLVPDYSGNAFQASDTVDLPATVRVLGAVRNRNQATQTVALRLDRDRDLGFKFDPFNPLETSETTLVAPKAVALAQVAGYMIVTDAGDPAVKVWGSAAAGNVAPAFSSSVPAPAWDVALDEPADRLYAALVDGTVAVFDDFLQTRPAAPSRVIVPSENGVDPSATSLRGIVHSTARFDDQLILCDIGAEGAAAGNDGSLIFIDDASTADGLTVPALVMRDPASGLMDPSDVVLAPDGRLRVADPAADRLSLFNPVEGPSRFAPTPARTSALQNANGIAIEPIGAERLAGVSDVDDPALALSGLVATTRPAGGGGSLLRLAEDLQSAPSASFDVGEDVTFATLDLAGDAYVGYPEGVAVVNRFAKQRGTGPDVAFDASRDRKIQNVLGPFDPPDPIVEPVAVEVDDRESLLLIADVGLPGIWVFGQNAGPTAQATRRIRNGFTAGVNVPQGLDYDADSDTLYVACSSGAVFVYESFVAVPGDLPDRTITPGDALGAVQISTDLRSVVHDAAQDLLILSDAGAAAGAGQAGSVYVVSGASTAGGLVPATSLVSGGATLLDEPQDLAWNGGTLWVAEANAGLVLRFDDLLNLSGDVAPSASLALPDVFSVELNPEFLSPASGGSITLD